MNNVSITKQYILITTNDVLTFISNNKYINIVIKTFNYYHIYPLCH